MVLIILTVLGYILSIIMRLTLHTLKLSLALTKVTGDVVASSLRSYARKSKISSSTGIVAKPSAIAGYLALKSAILVVSTLILILDILLFIITVLGMVWGGIVVLLIGVALLAGTYIIILNDTEGMNSTTNDGVGVTSVTVDGNKDSVKRGDSATAGMGGLTEDAKKWASTWNLTYIGDSLGAGSQSYFTALFPNAVYDSDPSRGLSSIKGQNTGEAGIETLERLVSEGNVRENLVVALGTNNDVTLETLKAFYASIPSNVKTITWVLTASEGGVPSTEINTTIKEFVTAHDNMRYLDWKAYVDENGGWGSYQGGDNIHMSTTGYEKYAQFQTQGLYDLYGAR